MPLAPAVEELGESGGGDRRCEGHEVCEEGGEAEEEGKGEVIDPDGARGEGCLGEEEEGEDEDGSG